METNNYKIVLFDQYCYKCKHKDLSEDQEPCNECMTNPVNLYSRRPVNFKEAKR